MINTNKKHKFFNIRYVYRLYCTEEPGEFPMYRPHPLTLGNPASMSRLNIELRSMFSRPIPRVVAMVAERAGRQGSGRDSKSRQDSAVDAPVKSDLVGGAT